MSEILPRDDGAYQEFLREVINLDVDVLQHRKLRRLNALNQLTQLRQAGKHANDILESIREERIQLINPFNNIS
jgi:hypothetical protein